MTRFEPKNPDFRRVAADTFARFPEATEILVPVVAANRASWRALEKAGFAIVASGDIPPDNPVDDPRHHVLRRTRSENC